MAAHELGAHHQRDQRQAHGAGRDGHRRPRPTAHERGEHEQRGRAAGVEQQAPGELDKAPGRHRRGPAEHGVAAGVQLLAGEEVLVNERVERDLAQDHRVGRPGHPEGDARAQGGILERTPACRSLGQQDAPAQPRAQRDRDGGRELGTGEEHRPRGHAGEGEVRAIRAPRVDRGGQEGAERSHHGHRGRGGVRDHEADVPRAQCRRAGQRGRQRRAGRARELPREGVGERGGGRGHDEAHADRRVDRDAQVIERARQHREAEWAVDVGEVLVGQLPVGDALGGHEVVPGVVGEIAPGAPGHGHEHREGEGRRGGPRHGAGDLERAAARTSSRRRGRAERGGGAVDAHAATC